MELIFKQNQTRVMRLLRLRQLADPRNDYEY